MVRIGVDARPLAGQLTGIGRYVLELFNVLDEHVPDATFFAFSPYPLSVALPSKRWVTRRPNSVPAYLGGYFWFKYLSPEMIARDQLDWFFGTRTLLPKLPPNVRTVSLVHDLNHVIAASTMTPLNRLAHALYFRRDVCRATRVVANSHATAERLIRYCGRQADVIVPPGVAPHFKPQSPSEVARVRSKTGLQEAYLLSVATMEPRKNIAALIDAFLSLRGSGSLSGVTLALAGGAGWRQGALAKRIHGGIPGVRSLGYVDDADLPALYAGAEAFVFPSLYEGYGIPVAEALACGTHVVTTDIPELREAARGRATFVATNAASIADGILRALAEPRLSSLPLGTAPDRSGFAHLFSSTSRAARAHNVFVNL